MAESFPKGYKTLWEKEKLLVTSNFSFYLSVFKRLGLQTRKTQGLFGKGLIPLEKKGFENTVGKEENAGYQHFLLFPQCFPLIKTQISMCEPILFCGLQML